MVLVKELRLVRRDEAIVVLKFFASMLQEVSLYIQYMYQDMRQVGHQLQEKMNRGRDEHVFAEFVQVSILLLILFSLHADMFISSFILIPNLARLPCLCNCAYIGTEF